jgi:hypothetical protein
MKPAFLRIILLALIIALSVHAATGHVPELPPAGSSLAGAVAVPDPAKSYAFYGTLHESGESDYYQMTLAAGELLHLSLSTPDPAPFTPQVAIMGPGIAGQDPVPSFVEVPAGAGVIVLPGSRPPYASYEPFTPMSLYDISAYDAEVTVSGTYYIAVYSKGSPGRYIFAPGYREEFSLTEWITVPVQVMAVHAWEGQSLLLRYGPVMFVLLAGIAFLYRGCPCIRRPRSAFSWAGSIAGLLYIGTGISMLVQMGIALANAGPGAMWGLTLVFALLPIILGVATVWLAVRTPVTRINRVTMAMLGILGLVVWAGLIIGPVIALVASVIPSAPAAENKTG